MSDEDKRIEDLRIDGLTVDILSRLVDFMDTASDRLVPQKQKLSDLKAKVEALVKAMESRHSWTTRD